MRENVIERGNFDRVIVVPRRTPSDVALKTLFPKNGDTKNMFFDIPKEVLIIFVGPDTKILPDVLEKMDMAELGEYIRKNVSGRHADCLVIIAGDGDERVIRILEFCEELHPCFVTLGERKEAGGDIVGSVIDTVKQWNLLLISLHFHVLAINDEFSAKPFSIAVIVRDIVVMGQSF